MSNRPMKRVKVVGDTRLVLYAGYATWRDRSGKTHVKEVRAYGKVVDDSDCGPGTRYVVALLTAKARKKWPLAVVNESWRY